MNGQKFITVDDTQISELVLFGNQGQAFAAPFVHIIMHELIHALDGLSDNAPSDFITPGADYVGDAVRRETPIIEQLGMELRNSYLAVTTLSNLNDTGVPLGTSLTQGRDVGLVLSETDLEPNGEVDLQDRSDTVLILGNGGDDSLRAGSNDDFVYGGVGGDIIIGHNGRDILFGNDGSDVLVGGRGNFAALQTGRATGQYASDSSTADSSGDYLVGGAGADTFFVDNVFAASRVATYNAALGDYTFNPTVRGTFDIIRDLTSEDQIIMSLQGADWLNLDNTVLPAQYSLTPAGFLFGEKVVYQATFGGQSANAVFDIYYDRVLSELINVLVVFEFEGKTPLFGIETAFPSEIQGGAGNDLLNGTASSDVINGYEGDDEIAGGAGDDHLLGGKGNDLLAGGIGSDIYYFASGDGADVISEEFDQSENNSLYLTDISVKDLTISTVNDDLLISVDEVSDSLLLESQYSASLPSGIETLVFGDGRSIQLGHSADTIWQTGTDDGDQLSGSSGDDFLMGKLGDDILIGDEGSDFYIFSKNDGNDLIADGNPGAGDVDTLLLTDIAQADVTLAMSGFDLQLIIDSTTETLTIQDQFRTDMGASWGIERFEFSDGTWDLTQTQTSAFAVLSDWTLSG